MSPDGVESVRFVLNGVETAVETDPATPLLSVLRGHLGLTGSRFGCGAGQCGACNVLLDGRTVASCDTPLWAVTGKGVTTIEGLGTPERPHPLQAALVAEQAAQCGYCTSGMIMQAAALIEGRPNITEVEVREGLGRNLCRCGTQPRVVRAVLRAATGRGA